MDTFWPPLIAAALLIGSLAWKLVPDLLTKFVGKEIERRSDAKLERIKAELQGSYSTLKTSVDVLIASNSGIRPHIIDSVSALWAQMIELRDKYSPTINLDSVFTSEEIERSFSQTNHAKILDFVRIFEEDPYNNKLFNESFPKKIEEFRLFCGDKLWLNFYIYRAILVRSSLLISWSFKERKYRDWRKDSLILQHLGSVMSKDAAQKLCESRFGGLSSALAYLEAEFLHEAARVMSGSKAMADSLADVQALLLLQNSIVAEQNDRK